MRKIFGIAADLYVVVGLISTIYLWNHTAVDNVFLRFVGLMILGPHVVIFKIFGLHGY